MANDRLRAVLSAGRQYSVEYGDRLSNHLPMAAIALQRLGADDKRLDAFTDFYSRRLVLRREPGRALGETGWKGALGDPELESALIHNFDDALRNEGKEATLRSVLPQLIAGTAGDAFHGLIRTAYAVDLGDDQEIASGLAASTIAYLEIAPETSLEKRFARMDDAVAALTADARFENADLRGPSIVARLARAAAERAFDDYRHAIDEVTLSDLARVAVEIYRVTDSFTALHLVTACHAFRILLPSLEDRRTALSHLATAMLAAYVAIGRPRIDAEQKRPPMPSWDSIASVAALSDDDHVLKLVYTARAEHRVYGWPQYQFVAARKAGLLR